MKKVFFLSRNNQLSIKRYILLVDALLENKLVSCFVSLNEQFDYNLVEQIKKYNYFKKVDIVLSDNAYIPSSFSKRIPYTKTQINRKKFQNHSSSVCIRFSPAPNSLSGEKQSFVSVIHNLGLDLDAMLEPMFTSFAGIFQQNLLKMDSLFSRFQPVAVVQDIELYPPTQAALLIAREKGIPSFSLEHFLGWNVGYSHFPPLSDYYFAYSKSNVRNLHAKGIPHENVFLTGAPEYDSQQISQGRKRKQHQNISVSPSLRILFALRPMQEVTFEGNRKDNISLAMEAVKHFGGKKEYKIVFRPHHRDDPFFVRNTFLQENIDINLSHIDDGRRIFQELLSDNDILITFRSSCVADGVLCGVPTCMIETHDGGAWPNWSDFDAFTTIEIDGVGNFLNKITTGLWPSLNDHPERKIFFEEFSMERSGAIKYIANTLSSLAEKHLINRDSNLH